MHSAAILLRVAYHRWAMQRALEKLVHDELVWHQGSQPRPEDREHARQVLEQTLLRHHTDDSAPVAGSPAAEERWARERLAEEILQNVNGDWSDQRLVHRCRLLESGSFCCRSRPWGLQFALICT